jgi:hypothetical protein
MSRFQLGQQQRAIRYPANPLDKCTIVSIYPKRIDEFKHTIQPGRFVVEPGTFKKPSILVVGSSSWWREIDEDQPLLEIPQSSVQVADSVVRDYCIGVIEYNGESAGPGLFYILGEHTVEDIQRDYSKELAKAKTRQDAWFTNLIKLATSLWARSNGNPLAISDDMRMAAREMGQTDFDWMKDFRMVGMERCKACGSLRNPDFPICPHCKNVDLDHPSAKGLKFAQ